MIFFGQRAGGELIIHKDLAEEVLDIFHDYTKPSIRWPPYGSWMILTLTTKLDGGKQYSGFNYRFVAEPNPARCTAMNGDRRQPAF
jgi:hypothetical protein